MRVLPSRNKQGIVFCRTDLSNRPCVVANWRNTGICELSTTLGKDNRGVSTIEHFCAALAALDIDSAFIEIDGPEVPILDGSSRPFLCGLLASGMEKTSSVRRHIRIIHDVQASCGASTARLEPLSDFAVDCSIDFAHPSIGASRFCSRVTKSSFQTDLAPARTFALLEDVEHMHARGLALGGSLDNAVVVGKHGVLNKEGLRFRDEFVRHKALDAIGDLYLLGAPIKGRYVSFCSGHALNALLVKTLMQSPDCWKYEYSSIHDSFQLEIAA